jgi:hypothetical protein
MHLGDSLLIQFSPGLWRFRQAEDPSYWRCLASLGVTDVIKLNFEREGSEGGARGLGMTIHYCGIEVGLAEPNAERTAEALRLLESGKTGILVHCSDGRNRTGLLVGMYRVRVDRWSKAAAFKEMIDRGFDPERPGLMQCWEKFK